MWCRRPYGFFFSSSDAAAKFAVAMQTSFELTPIGIESRQLVSSDAVEAMRQQEITRQMLELTASRLTGEGD